MIIRWLSKLDSESEAKAVENRVLVFAAVILSALTLALIYHGLLHLVGLGYPWDTFLFTPQDRFDDWFSSVTVGASRDPYLASKGSYFPLSYVLVLLGNERWNAASYAVFVAVATSLIGWGVVLFWKNNFASTLANTGHARSIFIALLLIAFLNYPVLFGLDRGNIDLWVSGLCLIYIAELRKDISWLGVVALSVAIAMKGYPMALILLRLRRRQYVQALSCIAVAAGLTLLALTHFKSAPGVSWHALQNNQHAYWIVDVLGSGSMVASADPYNAIRGLAWIALHAYQQIFAPAPLHLDLSNRYHVDFHEHAKFMKSVSGGDTSRSRALFANAYVGLTTLFAAVSSIFLMFVPSTVWKRIAVVAVMTILYPHVANDYKLLLLLPVAFTILAEPMADKKQASAFCLLALLLVPKSYLFFYGIGITMIIQPILLVCLWWIAISDSASWKRGLKDFRSRLAWFFFLRSDTDFSGMSRMMSRDAAK